MDKDQHILVGRTITSIKTDDDGDSLIVNTEEGEVRAWCYGDCCSYTWIEHIDLPARGFPAKVQAVHDLNMPDHGSMPGCDVVRYYGCKIVTDKGDIIIDYRNDSNGYYGGELEWPKG